jgi:hypothetical protein|tara:strand:- start:1817 stop:2551 length:735 start_codon:yes stop_codon:yes gene_type:complete
VATAEIIMKKSQIRQLVRETIMDMFEAEISKGGFTLQDFSKVHGGEAGGRKQDKGLFDLQKKVEFGVKGADIDAWRHKALLSGDKEKLPSAKYQRDVSKVKSVSAKIDSLAAIRAQDEPSRRETGGRAKPSTKVSAKYVGTKDDSIKQYNQMMDEEIAKLKGIQEKTQEGDVNFVALGNLIEDLELRKQEYALRWDFVTAAYSENAAAMDNTRESIKTVRSQLMSRQKAVGKEPEKNGKNGGKK